MVGWIILGVIVLIIAGINQIRIGADISYEEGVFALSAKVAGVMLQILPKQDKGEKKPKKEKRPKKKKGKKSEAKESEPKEKKGLPLGMNKEELFELAKAILHHFARFPRKFRIDRFKFHVLVAGLDPYENAMTYAYLNEALSILLPLARRGFRVKSSDVRTDVNFAEDHFRLDFAAGLSIRIGQIVGFILAIAFVGVKFVIKSKLRQKKERRAAAKAQPPSPPETEHKTENEIEKEKDKDIKPEERMDSNG